MATGKGTSASRPAAASRRPAEEPAAAAALPALSRAELAAAFAQALDLAEGRQPGHAARVCYIALNLARSVVVPRETQRIIFYAALLHDAGAAPASAELCRIMNLTEQTLFGTPAGQSPQQVALEIAPANAPAIVSVMRAHATLGAQVAHDLGCGAEIEEAIAAHHERWDGQGYPRALKADAIPHAGRVVAAADVIESLIAAESNPLTARRNLVSALAEHMGKALEPELARCARELVRSDTFWLGLHSGNLSQSLAAFASDGAEEESSPQDTWLFVRVFATLADAKGEHTAGHSERTAQIAASIAQALDMPEELRAKIQIAAQLHDVGLLGVPARVIAKPDILSLTEMEQMRKHPAYSQLVVELLPGLQDLALWVGAHHERPDGRGYPEVLEQSSIPLEARIIALADTYVALTSPRPYRQALSHEDAQQVLIGGAGTQLDRKLVQIFCAQPEALTSSRTAPRSQRRR